MLSPSLKSLGWAECLEWGAGNVDLGFGDNRSNAVSAVNWMALMSRLVSWSAADVEDVVNDAAPRWNPLRSLPSLLYCSMGIQTKSTSPFTKNIKSID